MRGLLVVAVLALAGCLSVGPTDDDGSQTTSASIPPATLFLTPEGELGPGDYTGSVALGWSLGEWLDGVQPPRWTGDEASAAYRITQANVTIVYDATAPVVHTDTRPPFTIWFGAGDAIVEHAFAPGPNPWDGSQQTITFIVDSLPQGGLVVPIGTAPTLMVGSYYADDANSESVRVLYGESRIDWTVESVELPQATASDPVHLTGELEGGRCVADTNQVGTAMDLHAFEVDESVVGLAVELEQMSGALADMDMYILDANGTRLAGAAGPATPEAIRLYEPNMQEAARGTWTLGIYNCHPQASSYQATLALAHSS